MQPWKNDSNSVVENNHIYSADFQLFVLMQLNFILLFTSTPLHLFRSLVTSYSPYSHHDDMLLHMKLLSIGQHLLHCINNMTLYITAELLSVIEYFYTVVLVPLEY